MPLCTTRASVPLMTRMIDSASGLPDGVERDEIGLAERLRRQHHEVLLLQEASRRRSSSCR